MKIVNIELENKVFEEVAKLAKKNKRSIRAEIAIIVEGKINENKSNI